MAQISSLINYIREYILAINNINLNKFIKLELINILKY